MAGMRLQPGTLSSLNSLRVDPSFPLPQNGEICSQWIKDIFRIISNIEDRRKKTGQCRVYPACRVLASGRTCLRSFLRSPSLPPTFRS